MDFVRLGDICCCSKGLSVPRARTGVAKDIAYLHYGDLYKKYNLRLKLDDVWSDIIKVDSSERYKPEQLLRDGDIVFALTSETVDDLGHSTLIVNKGDWPFVAGMETTVMHVTGRDRCFPPYLNYIFQSTWFRNILQQFTTGMKVYRVHPRDLLGISIPLPSLESQIEVSHILDSISDLIDVNSKINDYLDKLLRLQFEKTIENIESSVTLSEIADIQTGPFGSQLHQSDYVKEGTPLISVENLGNICIGTNKMSYVSEEDTERLCRYTMTTGDIIFSRVGYVDRSSFVSEYENGWIYSGSCLRIRAIRTVVSPLFLYYYLNQPCEKEYLKAIAVGATRPSLNTSILSEHKIDLPSNESMMYFDNIAASVQRAISNNKRRNEILEDLRNSLIKKLFQDDDK